MLFKYGSGTGTDLSTCAAAARSFPAAATPSGPLSFMRVYDQVAGGHQVRRQDPPRGEDADAQGHHPDIKEFITCKPNEEKKAWALIEQGYDGSSTARPTLVMFQNANLSVRVTDEFMQAVENDGEWTPRRDRPAKKPGTHSRRAT
jgi:ribonucleoside-diphosphate reductase alpha chain